MFDRILRFILTFGIYGLLVGRPLVSGLVYPSSNYIFFIWVVFLCFVWFLRSVFLGQFVIQRTRLDFLQVIFLIGLVISWFHSLNPYDGIHFFLNVATAILTYGLVIQVVQTELDLIKLVGVLLVAAAIVSFFGIYQGLFGLEETRAWVQAHLPMERLPNAFKSRLASPRIFSTLIYPNALAGYLLTIIPLAFAALWIRGRRLNEWIILISMISGALIFLLFEKPYWMGLAVSAFFYPLLYLSTFFLTLSKGGFVALFFVGVLWLFIFYRFVPDRFRRTFLGAALGIEAAVALVFFVRRDDVLSWAWPSIEVRWQYWRATLAMIRDFPWWGTGPGTFGSVYAHYKLPGAEETRMAHNNFLQVSSELGIFMGIVFLLIWMIPLGVGMWNCLMKRYEDIGPGDFIRAGASLGIFGFFAHGLLDFDLYEPAIALNAWVLLAISSRSSPGLKPWSLQVQSSLAKVTFILIGQVLTILVILGVRIPYQAEGYFNEALKAHSEKNLTLASVLIDQSLRTNPLNPQAHFLKGSISEHLGEWAGAVQCYEEASAKDPLNPAYPYRLAWVYQRLAQKEGKDDSHQIEKYLNKAVENYPSSPQYHLKLAQFYESVGRRDEALIEYSKVRVLGMEHDAVRKAIKKLKRSL